ncbi:MAG: GNAT family N-acetyltransferase [Anaerolineae bacterium]
MNFSIKNLVDLPHLLEDAIHLGNLNKKTLGFFPKGAYEKSRNDGQILIAIDQNNQLCGYLLFAVSSRKRLASIVHLCIKSQLRGNGLTRLLFDALKSATRNQCVGIRVRCRRDYEASKLWPKLGFIPVGDKAGRSAQGSILTIWFFDFNHPNLFSFALKQNAEDRMKVVLDANAFFELDKPIVPENQDVHALLSDWLTEDLELCLTEEIFVEIDRNENKEKRKRAREFARSFEILPTNNQSFQKVLAGLEHFFPEQRTESSESDMRQIARTLSANKQFFITRDERLLKKSQAIYDVYGLKISTPADVIIYQDSLIREIEYQPARLAGSRLKISRAKSINSIIHEQFLGQNETKSSFKRKVQFFLSDPKSYETFEIENDGNQVGLVIYDRAEAQVLNIPIIRLLENSLTNTLVRHLINKAVLTASGESRLLTKISDEYLSEKIRDGLLDSDFIFIDGGFWAKANLPFVGPSKNLPAHLEMLSRNLTSSQHLFSEISKAVDSSNSRDDLLEIERKIWPAKFTDISTPSFIVPILPAWAMHLFDAAIARQNLFGADPSVIFNAENVYYRSSHSKILTAPARVLWYVSKGNDKYQGTMSIRAVSYIDEVLVDKPKQLFSKFKRLGIYEWENVFEVAKNDTENEIMAFKFSKTEVFKNPVSRKQLSEMWSKNKQTRFHIQAPLRISNDEFIEIYQYGKGLG